MDTKDFRERYINPHTDFGFKYLFGTELNKDLLISLLNTLLRGEQTVLDVTYLNNEHLGISADSRRAIFDVYCENERGEKFIVEMQNVYQNFFKDRSVYYSTFPIREQAKRGDWDFNLTAVYTVGILNFVFDDDRDSSECYHHEVKLMDTRSKKVFYDKLTFIYLEVPKFNKREDELETMFDKWMYVLRHLSRLMERPVALQERVFERIFQAAEIARFSPRDLNLYEDSVKAYRDIVNAVNTARAEGLEEGQEKGREEGLKEGRKEGQLEIISKMKIAGLSSSAIAEITGLPVEDVDKV